MIFALIDNGSLEPAAQQNLRAVAAALSARTGVTVHAVSWKHSDRIAPEALSPTAGRAWTLIPFVRAQVARGERDFVFIPFFISAEGAIGSSLRRDLERLGPASNGLKFTFAAGLAAQGAIPEIAAARIRETIAAHHLHRPAVIVVDHGGPSPVSAALRDQLAARIRAALGPAIGPLAAASMEGAAQAHNRPLLADQLNAPGFDSGEIVIAPLFLSAGRHAGDEGDLVRIARMARPEASAETSPDRRIPRRHCYFTGLIGTHPLAVDALAAGLAASRSALPIPSPAQIPLLT